MAEDPPLAPSGVDPPPPGDGTGGIPPLPPPSSVEATKAQATDESMKGELKRSTETFVNTGFPSAGGQTPPDPTQLLNGLFISSDTDQLFRPKNVRVYTNTTYVRFFLNSAPTGTGLKTTWLVSMRHESIAASRTAKRGSQYIDAPILTSEVATKFMQNSAAKHHLLNSATVKSDFNGLAYELGRMLANTTIGPVGTYSLDSVMRSVDPTTQLDQLGLHATPYDTTTSRVFLPRSLGKSFNAQTFWVLAAAVMKAGGHVTVDCLEAQHYADGWKGMYPRLEGPPFAALLLEAIKYTIGVATECGDASGVMLAFVCGLHAVLSVHGHSDEGGIMRDVLRQASFVRPYGVMYPDPPVITSLPVVSMASEQMCMRNAVDSILLTTAAAVSLADPGTVIDGVRVPTIIGTKEDTTDEYGVSVTPDQLTHLIRQLSKNSEELCCNYVDVVSTMFGIVGRAAGEHIMNALFNSLMTRLQKDGDARHLRAGTCAPWYWVESNGLLPVCLATGRACMAWAGGPMGDRSGATKVPLIQGKTVDPTAHSLEAMNVDLKWLNLRSNLLFTLLDNIRPEMNKFAVLRSCHSNCVIYDGDRLRSRLPLDTRMHRGVNIWDLMWVRGECALPAPSELLYIAKGEWGLEITIFDYFAEEPGPTQWPDKQTFKSETYIADFTVPGIQGRSNCDKKQVPRLVYRRGSWAATTVGESGASWATNPRLFSAPRPVNTGAGPSFAAVAYENVRISKLNKGNLDAIRKLNQRLDEEAEDMSLPEKRTDYDTDEVYNMTELTQAVYEYEKLIRDRDMLITMMKDDTTCGDSLKTALGQVIAKIADADEYFKQFPPDVLIRCGLSDVKITAHPDRNPSQNIEYSTFPLKTGGASFVTKPIGEDKKLPDKPKTRSRTPHDERAGGPLRGTNYSGLAKSKAGHRTDKRRTDDEESLPEYPDHLMTNKHRERIFKSKEPRTQKGAPTDFKSLTDMINAFKDGKLGPAAPSLPPKDQQSGRGKGRHASSDGELTRHKRGGMTKDSRDRAADAADAALYGTSLQKEPRSAFPSAFNKLPTQSSSQRSLSPFDKQKMIREQKEHEAAFQPHATVPPVLDTTSTGKKTSTPIDPDSRPPLQDIPPSDRCLMDFNPLTVPGSALGSARSGYTYTSGKENSTYHIDNVTHDVAWKYLQTRIDSLAQSVSKVTFDATTITSTDWIRYGRVLVFRRDRRYLVSLHQLVMGTLELVSVAAGCPALRAYSSEMAHILVWVLCGSTSDGHSRSQISHMALVFQEMMLRIVTVGDLVDILMELTHFELPSELDSILNTWCSAISDEGMSVVLWAERPHFLGTITEPSNSLDFYTLMTEGILNWVTTFELTHTLSRHPYFGRRTTPEEDAMTTTRADSTQKSEDGEEDDDAGSVRTSGSHHSTTSRPNGGSQDGKKSPSDDGKQ